MRIVHQREKRDCGIACAAIVAGCTYEVAREAFKATGSNGIDTSAKELQAALAHLGVTAGGKRVPLGTRKLTDLARDVIVATNYNAQGWHWVVWDSENEQFLDPEKDGYKRLKPMSYIEILSRRPE